MRLLNSNCGEYFFVSSITYNKTSNKYVKCPGALILIRNVCITEKSFCPIENNKINCDERFKIRPKYNHDTNVKSIAPTVRFGFKPGMKIEDLMKNNGSKIFEGKTKSWLYGSKDFHFMNFKPISSSM